MATIDLDKAIQDRKDQVQRLIHEIDLLTAVKNEGWAITKAEDTAPAVE